MVVNCHVCDIKLFGVDAEEFRVDKDKTKCRKCHIDWLRDNIKSMDNSIYYMKLELKHILSKFQEWSESESDSEDEYLNNTHCFYPPSDDN